MNPRSILALLVSCPALWSLPACGDPATPPDDAPRPPGDAVVVPADAPDDVGARPDAPTDAGSPPDSPPGDAGPTHVVGSFALSISVPPEFGPNCTRAGADIDVFQMVLLDGSGVCVDATLHVEGAADFVARCDRPPASAPCFEAGMRVIGEALPVGAYHLLVTGVFGGTTCWSGDASIGVQEGTPSEQSLVLTPRPATCAVAIP